MRKRRILKDWIAYALITIQVLLFAFITGESDVDLSIELAIKTPLVMLAVLNHIIIVRHTEFYTTGF